MHHKHSLKSTDIWSVTPCSLVEVYRCFKAIYCLHRQGLEVSQARSRQQAELLFLLSLLFNPEDGSTVFYWTTWHHISEDSISCCSWNLKANIILLWSHILQLFLWLYLKWSFRFLQCLHDVHDWWNILPIHRKHKYTYLYRLWK
jgi:hypothetical protein